MILAGTLTGVQGDIRCKILAALKYLSWNWPNRGLLKEEVCSCYLFIEMKSTLTRFPTYVNASSLSEIITIKNIRISN